MKMGNLRPSYATLLLSLQNMEVEVRWRPYQLNPRAAQAGTNKLEYYKQKFGEQRTASMVPAMKARSA